VGRSRAFWAYFYPQAQRIFREALADVSLEDFYGAVNHSAPSLIRVEADEATYNLHIMLRFELERALVKGDLAPADIPEEWNRRFRDYLGIEVLDDARGCLQDIHWSSGGIGYFPTYTLGNLYAAQFFDQARRDLPDLNLELAQGRMSGLREWLREKIHRHGSRYPAGELVRRVTGAPLSPQPLVSYLNRKFSGIYGF
jgi:carboxypeptidase Taq